MPAPVAAFPVRRIADEFTTDIPLGEWGLVGGKHEYPQGWWKARPHGYPDSREKSTGAGGLYSGPKTTSQHDGLLDIWVHWEGDQAWVSAPLALPNGVANDSPTGRATDTARISVCFRSDPVPGFKTAWLLWPTSGSGNEHGEIDFPEGRLDSKIHGFMHWDPEPSSGQHQNGVQSDATFTSWHVATIEWVGSVSGGSTGGYTKFYLDGKLLGHFTKMVPRSPMWYVMQTETWLPGAGPLPCRCEGHVYVDWFTYDTR